MFIQAYKAKSRVIALNRIRAVFLCLFFEKYKRREVKTK
jgi:hypothetical protein